MNTLAAVVITLGVVAAGRYALHLIGRHRCPPPPPRRLPGVAAAITDRLAREPGITGADLAAVFDLPPPAGEEIVAAWAGPT